MHGEGEREIVANDVQVLSPWKLGLLGTMFRTGSQGHLGSEHHNEREALGLSSVGGGHASDAEGD